MTIKETIKFIRTLGWGATKDSTKQTLTIWDKNNNGAAIPYPLAQSIFTLLKEANDLIISNDSEKIKEENELLKKFILGGYSIQKNNDWGENFFLMGNLSTSSESITLHKDFNKSLEMALEYVKKEKLKETEKYIVFDDKYVIFNAFASLEEAQKVIEKHPTWFITERV